MSIRLRILVLAVALVAAAGGLIAALSHDGSAHPRINPHPAAGAPLYENWHLKFTVGTNPATHMCEGTSVYLDTATTKQFDITGGDFIYACNHVHGDPFYFTARETYGTLVPLPAGGPAASAEYCQEESRTADAVLDSELTDSPPGSSWCVWTRDKNIAWIRLDSISSDNATVSFTASAWAPVG